MWQLLHFCAKNGISVEFYGQGATWLIELDRIRKIEYFLEQKDKYGSDCVLYAFLVPTGKKVNDKLKELLKRYDVVPALLVKSSRENIRRDGLDYGRYKERVYNTLEELRKAGSRSISIVGEFSGRIIGVGKNDFLQEVLGIAFALGFEEIEVVYCETTGIEGDNIEQKLSEFKKELKVKRRYLDYRLWERDPELFYLLNNREELEERKREALLREDYEEYERLCSVYDIKQPEIKVRVHIHGSIENEKKLNEVARKLLEKGYKVDVTPGGVCERSTNKSNAFPCIILPEEQRYVQHVEQYKEECRKGDIYFNSGPHASALLNDSKNNSYVQGDGKEKRIIIEVSENIGKKPLEKMGVMDAEAVLNVVYQLDRSQKSREDVRRYLNKTYGLPECLQVGGREVRIVV